MLIATTLSQNKTQSLDDTLSDLDAIIEWSLKEKNRNGYFAALYKNITKRVKAAIANQEFEDNERMHQFVLHFAAYYINAVQKYELGKLEITSPWFKVLQLGKEKHSIVQHLLWGVNTHINYDLANTCLEICPGEKLLGLCNDFVKINNILATAISEVEEEIASLSPILALSGKLIPKFESDVLNFSITVARSKSWECACMQALEGEAVRNTIRNQSLTMTEKLTNKILHPGYIASMLMFLIKLTEIRGIKYTMMILTN